MAPEIHSPGLESVWGGEGDKEVYSAPGNAQLERSPQRNQKTGRICGLKKYWFWAVLTLILVLAVGLGAGLGAGLGTKHHSSKSSATPSASSTSAAPSATSTSTSDYAIGGALNPAYYTNKGAFNGSGIALASQSFGVNDYGALVMYFQHAEGQIRWQRLDTASGDWVGGTSSEIVAYDAKNGIRKRTLFCGRYRWLIDKNRYPDQRCIICSEQHVAGMCAFICLLNRAALLR